MTATATTSGLRLAIEVVAWTVVIACLLAVTAITSFSLFGSRIARLCRSLARVPTAQKLLFDPRWRASPQLATPSSTPPACVVPRRLAG